MIIFFTELIIFKSRFLSPEGKLSAGLCFVLIFWGGNLYFLHQHDKKQFPENLKTIEEYQASLKRWDKKSNPFRHEIRTALHQLEAFAQKQRALIAFDNSFQNISEETENYLLTNMRKILHRIMILDFQDNLQIHRAYLNLILHQNQKILYQYDNFLIAVFQTDEPAPPCLEAVTEAIREIRKESF